MSTIGRTACRPPRAGVCRGVLVPRRPGHCLRTHPRQPDVCVPPPRRAASPGTDQPTKPVDQFAHLRPLLAYHEAGPPPWPHDSLQQAGSGRVELLSLRHKERLDGDPRPLDIPSGYREHRLQRIDSTASVVALATHLAVLCYSAGSLQFIVPLSGAAQARRVLPDLAAGSSVTHSLAFNPVALGDRWLAFASHTEPTQKDLNRSGFRGEPAEPGLNSACVYRSPRLRCRSGQAGHGRRGRRGGAAGDRSLQRECAHRRVVTSRRGPRL